MCAHIPELQLVIKSHLNANVIIIYNKSTSIILAAAVCISCCRHPSLQPPSPISPLYFTNELCNKSLAIIPKIYGTTLKYAINYLIMKAPHHFNQPAYDNNWYCLLAHQNEIVEWQVTFLRRFLIRFDDVHKMHKQTIWYGWLA